MIQITKTESRSGSDDMMEVDDNTDSSTERKGRAKWPLVLVVLLLIAFGLVGYAEINNGHLSKLLTRLFGPPRVQLKESFTETPLRNEAYTGHELESQLADQASYVHHQPTWFNYEEASGQLRLTQLYNWYGNDFVQLASAVQTFAAKYSPELKNDLNSGKKPSIGWLDYDWTLNDITKKSPR